MREITEPMGSDHHDSRGTGSRAIWKAVWKARTRYIFGVDRQTNRAPRI